ncbi:hypothetical protein OKA06_18895 [Novosphingobium sp. MW5]|nr:hypothetical protein [Novosphingobium sp. MW5]
MGTGGTGGLFYVLGAGMADLITEHMPDTTARAEVTGASVENIRRTAAGEMEMGFSSSSTLYEAANGIGAFEGDPQGCRLDGVSLPRRAADRDHGADRHPPRFRISPGTRSAWATPGSNAAVLAMRLLGAYGVFDASNAQFLSYSEGVDALTNGTVDAAVVLAGAPVAALIDLDARADMVLLSVDAATVAGMLEEFLSTSFTTSLPAPTRM